MKYKIENLNDITDSREVMQSKPQGFSTYMTYIILALLTILIIWSLIAHKEISVKASGVVRPSNNVTNIASGVMGNITKLNVNDGDKVKKGDILLVVNGDEYVLQRDILQESLDRKNKELEALDKLKESVLDGKNRFDLSNDLQKDYYKKYQIYLDNLNSGNSQGVLNEKQKLEIESNISNLDLLKKAISEGKNYFTEGSTFYYQYKDYEIVINNYKDVIKSYGDNITKLQQEINDSNKEEVEKEINILKKNISNSNEELKKYKNTTMMNISSEIDQNNSKLNQLQVTTTSTYKEQYLSSIESNISSMQSSIDDINMNLKVINEKIDSTSIKAPCDGIVNMISQVKIGDFIQNGTEIASIVPENNSDFNIEVYIDNQSFGEIEEGQDVVIELVSLPGREYGYIKSNLKDISVDAKISQEKGTSYYTANCPIGETSLKNRKGESINIKNGMLAEVRIVSREASYLRYFLEKIDVLN
ncbi:HlyD family efflux transporter periplasmic adaptor subunit [Clostridium paraputrificum]|uniref:HlyD family efflux transporter periplasmic adaptor subunit n=1 Tax=Clostridium paraputrificum TaxID=29363 RepID=UPI001898F23D|nr:HlyD family efflux transporter periplasmic adaptor subunit [Clostridium paraputrificum]MDC0800703.1 HlyD family efflux transporter periplasmic adaptor subunit [Clostridium paraputrificum]